MRGFVEGVGLFGMGIDCCALVVFGNRLFAMLLLVEGCFVLLWFGSLS